MSAPLMLGANIEKMSDFDVDTWLGGGLVASEACLAFWCGWAAPCDHLRKPIASRLDHSAIGQ